MLKVGLRNLASSDSNLESVILRCSHHVTPQSIPYCKHSARPNVSRRPHVQVHSIQLQRAALIDLVELLAQWMGKQKHATVAAVFAVGVILQSIIYGEVAKPCYSSLDPCGSVRNRLLDMKLKALHTRMTLMELEFAGCENTERRQKYICGKLENWVI